MILISNFSNLKKMQVYNYNIFLKTVHKLRMY